jgi:WD40 repeat protein
MVEIVVKSGHQINVTNAAFAPGGRSLATTGADESVRLWDIGLCYQTGQLRGHRGPVYQFMFSGNGSLLATDHAASVSSGRRFPEGRTPLPRVREISCDHLSCFSTVAGLAEVADGLSPRTGP